jgi:hypothetical protein
MFCSCLATRQRVRLAPRVHGTQNMQQVRTRRSAFGSIAGRWRWRWRWLCGRGTGRSRYWAVAAGGPHHHHHHNHHPPAGGGSTMHTLPAGESSAAQPMARSENGSARSAWRAMARRSRPCRKGRKPGHLGHVLPHAKRPHAPHERWHRQGLVALTGKGLVLSTKKGGLQITRSYVCCVVVAACCCKLTCNTPIDDAHGLLAAFPRACSTAVLSTSIAWMCGCEAPAASVPEGPYSRCASIRARAPVPVPTSRTRGRSGLCGRGAQAPSSMASVPNCAHSGAAKVADAGAGMARHSAASRRRKRRSVTLDVAAQTLQVLPCVGSDPGEA